MAQTTQSNQQAVAIFSAPRLPYHDVIKERFGIDKTGWKALVEAVFPNAKTPDAVAMALAYCHARKLDIFKRPVHIVPMWSSAAGQMVETVWPGISELRTTAFRTKQYAGIDSVEWGPEVEMTFEGTSDKGRTKGQTRTVVINAPTWCRMTVLRELNGKERKFIGPKVKFTEAMATWADTDVPNDMWAERPEGQLEKCAEAAALRRAFPEELGNELTAEEMEGRRLLDPGAQARDVTPREEPPEPPAPKSNPAPGGPGKPKEGGPAEPATTAAAEAGQHADDDPPEPETVEKKPAAGKPSDVGQGTRGTTPAEMEAAARVRDGKPADDFDDSNPAGRDHPPQGINAPATDGTVLAPCPNPNKDYEAYRTFVVAQFAAATGPDLEDVWNDYVEFYKDDLMPPDFEDLNAAYRKRERELA